jgi:hypothetical protein
MKHIPIIFIALTLILFSCAPKISTTISKSYSTLDYFEEVRVLGIQDSIPSTTEELGIIKIGDAGFTTNCGWDVVIEKAKIEARKVGGNAIKIIKHTPPDMGSSCHRITAKILKVDKFDPIPITVAVDSSIIKTDYAVLNVYRFSGTGAFVNYDLHLGDSVICRVSNKWKKSIKIKKDGLNTLWAKTEAKAELPINIKFGHEYFIRCSVTMGAFVGHPKIDLVNNQTGKVEFQSIKLSNNKKRDLILMDDEQEIECIINNEDSEFVYITIFKNAQEINTKVSKTQIKNIQRCE